MRTAILSDLHLGAASDEDVLRDAAIRRVLLEEIGGADRVVLLGDVLELRDLPIGTALERARPFFEDLGAALGEREVTIVPGNHDHRLAEPLLDELSIADAGPLGLEHRHAPSAAAPLGALARWLRPARLEVAYPGLWIRDDVYATHGHYMDAHMRLPRTECLAVAAMIRATGPLPDPATPSDYERVTRPIYGFGFGVAQGRSAVALRGPYRPSEAAWRLLAGPIEGSRARRARLTAARRGFPVAVRGLNRLLRADFDVDVSPGGIFRGGLAAAIELARRLRVDGGHVITGHSHRGGPIEGERPWPLPGGGSLHNTGSWCFATAFHNPGTPPNDYWPGTVTWVEGDAPPRRVELLRDRSHAEMAALVGGG